MSNAFASGRRAIAICDRCGQTYKLKQLRKETVKTKEVNRLVCPTCWDPDHPQLMLGMFPVNDPQALRNPRPDMSYGESRDIQWGWNPVGGSQQFDAALTPNNLVISVEVGTVTVAAS